MNTSNDTFDASVQEALLSTVEDAVLTKLKAVVHSVVHEMIQNDPQVHAIHDSISSMLSTAIKIEIEALVKKRTERTLIPSLTKIILEAELRMANDLLSTKISIIEGLEAHLRRRGYYFQTLDGLLESACVDFGEDSLCGGGPLTDILNFAHDLNDEDEKVLKQTVRDLQNGLISKELIAQMEADLAGMGSKEEGAAAK